jgi:uncharacterized protein
MNQPVAVVTGASSGIGREFARRLSSRGYLVLAVARRAELLEDLAHEAPGVVPLTGDVTDAKTLDEVLSKARELGGIDLLICNAGRGHFGPFHEASMSVHRELLDLNLSATVGLVHRVLPEMRRRGSGGIIVLSSNLGVVPTPNMAVYAGTKAFLLSWTHALIHENRGSGVRFMALCPGPTASGFSKASGLGAQVEKTPGYTTAPQVVDSALRAWDAGRDSVIPGRIMRMMTQTLDFAPRPIGRRIMGRIFA